MRGLAGRNQSCQSHLRAHALRRAGVSCQQKPNLISSFPGSCLGTLPERLFTLISLVTRSVDRRMKGVPISRLLEGVAGATKLSLGQMLADKLETEGKWWVFVVQAARQ